ncbi:MAG TPA: 3-hydroxyacyl-ACP dehydratase [Parafilimonas sp.]|nr:3-hydroxyacyl-ACP dehydratase [Parafilimonas sp.]
MLKDSLYIIQNITKGNNTIEAAIELNEHHDIFKGHFPGQPVLPGVCMLQMTKEILGIFFHYKVQLLKAEDIRFLAMVDPTQNKELKFVIQYDLSEPGAITVNAKITKKDDVVCCKIKAVFNQQD